MSNTYKPQKQRFAAANNLLFYPPIPQKLDGGLNLIDKEWKLPDDQTSNVLNMWFKDGELSKRYGQEYVNTDLGTIIYNAYRYKYLNKIVFHSGTKIYTLDTTTGTTTEILTGMSAIKGEWFKFNNKLYYFQTGKYVQWDGTTASDVVPYIPTVIINRTPTGGGNTNEQYNRIGKGFKNSFNGTGAATVYTLTDTGLDATTVTCTIGGVSKTEGVDFTVNRTTGVVTFSVAPASGTNNVIITAYKTTQTTIDSILNCKFAIPFGGQNDNRMFFGGNGTGYFYWTGITTAGVDPTYFPFNNYNIIGLTDEDITGFAKHYDVLCIFKEKEIFAETYSFDGTTGIFNTYQITSEIGCNCPESIQTVNNHVVFLNSYNGVYLLVGTQVNSQRNVFPISRNINPRLLAESNIKLATSVNFNGKYWLCVNDKVYLWDYFISPYQDTGNPEESAKKLSWWYFDNINAGCFVEDGTDLYYGHRTLGRFIKFHTTYDNTQFYDFGNSYSAIYRYPFRAIGNEIYEFNLLKGFVSIKGDLISQVTVQYFTNEDFNGDPATETITVGSFSWLNWNWNNFIWQVMGVKFEAVLQPLAKNITLFGAEFTNNAAGKDMNISGLQWQYQITRLVK